MAASTWRGWCGCAGRCIYGAIFSSCLEMISVRALPHGLDAYTREVSIDKDLHRSCSANVPVSDGAHAGALCTHCACS